LRKPKFLSPSSKSRWLSNRTGFYTKYLADTKQERAPQEIYMGVGSGFDAFVKSEIMTRCYGKPMMRGTAFDFETLFEAQVEHHHRDRSLAIATEVWEAYKASGALEALWSDIEKSPCAPMMEERVEGTIGGVPLLGLPDLVYVDWRSLLKVVTDFKIMGSGSAKGGGASPPQGFMVVRDGWTEGKPSKNNGEAHKKHVPFEFGAGDLEGLSWPCDCDLQPGKMEIGKAYLEDFNLDWADQMSTYAWLLGSKVGAEDFIVRIECGSCRHPKTADSMKVKWSTHMNRVSNIHQIGLMRTYKEIWKCIEDEHIFSDMTKEDSQSRCEVLEMQAAAPQNTHSALRNMGADNTNWFMRTG
jgi:hypothetical protein